MTTKLHGCADQTRRRGAIAVLAAAMLVVVLGLAALAVDMGYLYNAKAEAQRTADAAALAAAAAMFDEAGLNQARAVTVAGQVAGHNPVMSQPITLQQMDVVLGRKDNLFVPDAPFVAVADNTSNAVSVTVHCTQARGSAMPVFFAGIFGKDHADVSATAIAGRLPVSTVPIVPVALRTPDFGPVDPDIAQANPGKDGPSYPANGASFVLGEKVTLFIFGNGPRQPVHLVLDLPQFSGVAETNELILGGQIEPVPLSVGDRMPAWGEGTGNANFGEKLVDRMQDADPDNDTIVIPVVGILPESRDANGDLAGDIEIVDFVGVHLDAMVQFEVQDPRFPDDPTKTLLLEKVVGTVVPVQTNGVPTSTPAGYASGVHTVWLVW